MTAAHRRLLLATTASGLGDDARMFAGPLLGALLCARAAPLPFVLDAAWFAAAFVLLLGLPRGSRQVAPARAAQWHEDMLAGARYLLANRTLRILGPLLGRTQAAFNLIATTAFSAGTLAGGMVAHRLGLRAPILLGALLVLGGLGAVLVAVDLATDSERRPAARSGRLTCYGAPYRHVRAVQSSLDPVVGSRGRAPGARRSAREGPMMVGTLFSAVDAAPSPDGIGRGQRPRSSGPVDPLLPAVRGPADVRALDGRPLPSLAPDVREFLVAAVCRRGGPPG